MTREEFDANYTAHLNAQQREAVHAVNGAVLLLAVPGSGKTTVLVTRLGYMVCCCGIAPERILTMTYTVAATREMKQRFARLFGAERARGLEFRTINGVSSKIIAYYTRTHGSGQAFSLMEDDGEAAELIAGIYQELRREYPTPGTIKDIRTLITYVKNQMLTPEEIRELDAGMNKFPELYDRYCAALRQVRRMDYDDQMVYAKTILERYPDVLAYFQEQYPYICVDESQDTSKIQHAIIRLLAKKHGNLFLVGDEDQSIYGFRAAYPDALLHFEQAYPGAKVLLMEENYRSTPEILHAADAFIQKNKARRPKTIRPTRSGGAAVHVIHTLCRETQFSYLLAIAEAGEGMPAVLYRNNDSALPLIDMLDRRGISYQCRQFEDNFFTNRLILDIFDIIRFSFDGMNAACFLRIYFKLGSGISRAAAEFACAESQSTGKPILNALLRFPELSEYTKGSVERLITLFTLLKDETAEQGISRIWTDMRYGAFAELQKLDQNKFAILQMLAKPEKTLPAFLARMERLRDLIAVPQQSADAKLLLSTIHSSKGLEYGTVYLLDVLDDILPPDPAPSDPAALRQYEEERRLFYVAMTRAKDHLSLFCCRKKRSSFVEEVLRELPVEADEPNDVFASLKADLCGKTYRHNRYGAGVIQASGDSHCLIAFAAGKRLYLTIGEMFMQREIVLKKPLPPAKLRSAAQPAAQRLCSPLTKDEEAALIARAVPGSVIRHTKFGAGTVVSFTAPYIEIRFSDASTKKFDLLDSVCRGLLLLS